MHFIRNLEDDKLEIHFTKPEYMKMDNEKKQFFKSRCLFSGTRQCWRSRGKIDSVYWLKTLIDWGFEDRGTEGERLSFADQVEREQAKAEVRAERSEKYMEKNEKASESAFDHAHDMLQVIPPGQPILVGHHSEKRHRGLLAKHDNTMRKAFDLKEKSAYYAEKLKNAQYTADGTKFKNMGYLANRIKECERDINIYKRRLEGKMYSYSQPSEISEKEKEYWTRKLEEVEDKLGYMTYCLQQIQVEDGKILYDKNTLAGKKHVKIKGRWMDLVKCNPKSITATSFGLSLKYLYGEIQEAK